MLVTGEPGIGKTGLARALSATAGAMGIRTGWGRCEEAAGAPALWPWSQALGSLVSAAGTATRLPALAALLPAPDGRAAAAARRTSTRRPSGWPRPRPSCCVTPVRSCSCSTTCTGRTGTRSTWSAGSARSGRPAAVLLLTSRDAEAVGRRSWPRRWRTSPVPAFPGRSWRAGPGGRPRLRPAPARRRDPRRGRGGVAGRTDGNPFFVGELVQLLADERRLTERAPRPRPGPGRGPGRRAPADLPAARRRRTAAVNGGGLRTDVRPRSRGGGVCG